MDLVDEEMGERAVNPLTQTEIARADEHDLAREVVLAEGLAEPKEPPVALGLRRAQLGYRRARRLVVEDGGPGPEPPGRRGSTSRP